MSNFNLILSREKFNHQKYAPVKGIVKAKLNEYYAEKKNSRKINLATVGAYVSIPLFIIAVILLLSSVAISFVVIFKTGNSWLLQPDHFRPLLASLYSLAFVFLIAWCILYPIVFNARVFLKRDIVASVNNRELTDHLLDYIGLKPLYKNDESGNKIVNFANISFFKNTSNFKNLSKFNVINNKYEMYEAVSNKQLIRMQNIEFRSEEWIKINDLSNKEIKKLKSAKSLIYKDKIQKIENKLYFGIAAKLLNLNKNVSLTLFDELNNYTPEGFKKVEVKDEFMSLNINSEEPSLMQKWASYTNNLSYLSDLKNEFDSIAINSSISLKNSRKDKSFAKDLAILIKNQEAFIWFKTPTQLLDLYFKTPTLNKETVTELIVNKILDEFYLVYLSLMFLAPFGYDNVVSISENEAKDESSN
ncbi:MAG2810 family protein [Mycoplasmopsis agalactiae]|uniref:MAG2810 family protein n=1 Tax=Mycoplasmopsis agalactiae TaxID=2110 RepID=UPI002F3EED1E